MRSSRGDESRMVIRERERESYSGDLKRFVARVQNKSRPRRGNGEVDEKKAVQNDRSNIAIEVLRCDPPEYDDTDEWVGHVFGRRPKCSLAFPTSTHSRTSEASRRGQRPSHTQRHHDVCRRTISRTALCTTRASAKIPVDNLTLVR